MISKKRSGSIQSSLIFPSASPIPNLNFLFFFYQFLPETDKLFEKLFSETELYKGRTIDAAWLGIHFENPAWSFGTKFIQMEYIHLFC